MGHIKGEINGDRHVDTALATQLFEGMHRSTANPTAKADAQAVVPLTEEALRTSLTRLQQVVDHLPQAIGWKDKNAVFLGCNQAFAQAVGLSHSADIVGKVATEMQWHSQPAAFLHDRDCHLIEQQQAEYHQFEALSQAEPPVWLDVSRIPLHDEHGALTGLLTVVEEATDRKQAEAILRQSEATNRALINAVPDLLFRIRQDETYLDVQSSKSFKVLNPDQLTVGAKISNSLPSELAQQRTYYVQKALSTGELQIYEQELVIDGVSTYEEVRIVPCQADEVMAMVRDITDRKQAEAALKLAQFSIDHAADAIWWIEPNGTICYVNDATCRDIGYAREELLGKRVLDFAVDFTDAAWVSHWEEIKEQGSFSFETQNRHKNGTIYPVEVTVNYIELNGNALNCSFVRNISDRKQAEAALRQSEQQMREQAHRERLLNRLVGRIRDSLDFDKILETTLQEVQNFTDADRCQFAWYKPNCEKSHWEIVKETRYDHLPSLIHRSPVSPTSPLLVQLLDLQILRIDDVETLPASSLLTFMQCFSYKAMLAIPVRMQSGLLGTIFCCHSTEARSWSDCDIDLIQAVMAQLAIALTQADLYTQSRTKAQALEQALRELQKTQTQMVQSEKMSSLGQLVAGVAHEINNPVNFIYGNLAHASSYAHDLLHLIQLYQQHYPLPVPEIQAEATAIDLDFLLEDLPKLLASMRVGAERIQQIVLSLRNFSRMDEAEVKQVDIHEGIDSTLMILQSRFKGNPGHAGIEIIKRYGQLPLVECYPGQLNQVFMNLLSNAIDALEEAANNDQWSPTNDQVSPAALETVRDRKPTIRIQTEQLNSESIVIKIVDNGCGMTQAHQQRLFDPFFTTKPIGKGTGLGLSISYQIVVEKHGGALTCFSVQGTGTEFCIEIPMQQSVSSRLV